MNSIKQLVKLIRRDLKLPGWESGYRYNGYRYFNPNCKTKFFVDSCGNVEIDQLNGIKVSTLQRVLLMFFIRKIKKSIKKEESRRRLKETIDKVNSIILDYTR